MGLIAGWGDTPQLFPLRLNVPLSEDLPLGADSGARLQNRPRAGPVDREGQPAAIMFTTAHGALLCPVRVADQ